MKRSSTRLIVTLIMIALATACGNSSTNQDNLEEPAINPAVLPTATVTTTPQPATEELTEELPPLSFDEILEEGIESGTWTEGEGLVLFLKYFTGESADSEIEMASDVTERAGTGVVRMAGDYLNQSDSAPAHIQEIERLLRMILPPQEVLDAISRPVSLRTSYKLAASSLRPSAQNQTACMDFAGTGYEGKIDLGVTCYYYAEQELDGNKLRVYYPEWWQGDTEKENQVGLTLDAMAKAAITYSSFSP